MLEKIQQEKEKLTGQVVGIVYHNSDNGYTVCDIETEDDTVTAVGYMPQIAEGESVMISADGADEEEAVANIEKYLTSKN